MLLPEGNIPRFQRFPWSNKITMVRIFFAAMLGFLLISGKTQLGHYRKALMHTPESYTKLTLAPLDRITTAGKSS